MADEQVVEAVKVEATVEVKAMTLDDLKASMAAAIANNDVAAIEAIADQITGQKRARAKVEADALRVEAEALAGVREKLAEAIHAAVTAGKAMPEIAVKLAEVKATGYTFKLDEPAKINEAGVDIAVKYKGVALHVPTVKASGGTSGNGGANRGTTFDQYGRSLDSVYEEYATSDDRSKMAAAKSGGAKWQVKTAVLKREIATGNVKPLK